MTQTKQIRSLQNPAGTFDGQTLSFFIYWMLFERSRIRLYRKLIKFKFNRDRMIQQVRLVHRSTPTKTWLKVFNKISLNNESIKVNQEKANKRWLSSLLSMADSLLMLSVQILQFFSSCNKADQIQVSQKKKWWLPKTVLDSFAIFLS